jgi:hypothetical protein
MRIEFLKAFVKDVLENNRKTWLAYGEQFGEHPERVRKWLRTFKATFPTTGEWHSGVKVEDDWLPKVREALEFADAVSPTKFPEKYDGVKPRRAWEQRTKDGTVVTLHSYEFNSELEDLKKFQENLIEKVASLVRESSIQPVVPRQEPNHRKFALNIYTSDKHAGSQLRNPLFDSHYDDLEFERRLQETLKAVELVKGFVGQIDLINFVDLGDGIDGVGGKTTRGGHGLDQYLEDTDQFDLYVESHKRLFDAIHKIEAANRVQLTVASNDNHGGFGMYVAARALQEYLKVKYPEMIVDVNRAFIFHQEYGIHRFIFSHGKDDRYRSRPLPMRLDADAERLITEYIDYHRLAKHLGYAQERACVHFIKGDLHSSTEEYGKRFRYKNIMSMFGSSTWIQHNFGAGYKGFEFEIVDHDSPLILSAKNFYF